MHNRSGDLAFVIATTIAMVVVTFMGLSDSPVRVIPALLLVLMLPGYSVTAMVFVKRELQIPERLVLSLGLSLALAALSGLVLNWTPWGLRAESWVVLLSGITLVASTVALVRRRGCPTITAERRGTLFNTRQGLLMGSGVLVLVGAIWVAHAGAIQQRTPGFTQLWILPANEADSNVIRLGLHSSELVKVRYRLQMKLSGYIVHEWSEVELKPGETWTVTVVLPAEQLNAETVEAVLYRLDAPGVIYRRVALWRDGLSR